MFIAWESYGRSDIPPLIRWIRGSQLNCDKGKGFTAIDIDTTPDAKVGLKCYTGFTWSDREILVAWHGEISFSETSLAHELLHAALLREGIFLDHHSLPYFFDRVDKANELIIKAGR